MNRGRQEAAMPASLASCLHSWPIAEQMWGCQHGAYPVGRGYFTFWFAARCQAMRSASCGSLGEIKKAVRLGDGMRHNSTGINWARASSPALFVWAEGRPGPGPALPAASGGERPAKAKEKPRPGA